MDLAVGFGQFPLHGLGLLAVLPHFSVDLPDVLIDLVTVIAPHHRHELTRRGFFEEVGQRGVNVRLHVARSWLDVTTTGVFTDLRRVIGPAVRTAGLRLPSNDTHTTLTPGCWRVLHGLDPDFTRAVFDSGSFAHAQFTGGTDPSGNVQFTGSSPGFDGAEFLSGAVRFTAAQFNGAGSFKGARFAGDRRSRRPPGSA